MNFNDRRAIGVGLCPKCGQDIDEQRKAVTCTSCGAEYAKTTDAEEITGAFGADPRGWIALERREVWLGDSRALTIEVCAKLEAVLDEAARGLRLETVGKIWDLPDGSTVTSYNGEWSIG